ncbi:MAG: AlpA family transcriptional regulator [Gammaproteobacteria bacterium]|nr:AlpA family transcriptional regulator [Gammaproteobacteria bacterium]
MEPKTTPPVRVLRLPEVMARTGLSRSTIYRWRLAGRFPQPIPLGERCVGWIEAELDEWLRERTAERPGGG